MSSAILSSASLSYDLLLKKTAEQCSERLVCPVCDNSGVLLDESCPLCDGCLAVDEASTAEPETSCAASVMESTPSFIPTKSSVTVLYNVSHVGPHSDRGMENLIQQTRELSELVFDEDCLVSVTKKSRWKLSLLITNDFSTLCGFAVTRITNGALSIAKIAVPVEYRGHGFGRLLMDYAINLAKKQNDIYEVCLSSLSTAVTFYQRLGFKAMTGVKVKTDFEVVEGQVYMVKKLRPRPRGK